MAKILELLSKSVLFSADKLAAYARCCNADQVRQIFEVKLVMNGVWVMAGSLAITINAARLYSACQEV